MNVLPSSDAIVKGVVMTAIGVAIISLIKPHLPAGVSKYFDL